VRKGAGTCLPRVAAPREVDWNNGRLTVVLIEEAMETAHEVREGVWSQRIGNLLTGGLMENTLIGGAEDWEPPQRRLDGNTLILNGISGEASLWR
jgi:hypothetical protein